MIPRASFPLLLASLIAVPTPSPAQDSSRPPDLSGAYLATGTNPGESAGSYEAKVELKRTGEVVLALSHPERTAEVYRIKWKFGGGAADVLGLGVLLDGVLYVAYADEKKFFLEFWFPWTMSSGQALVEAEIQEAEGQSSKSYIKNRPWYSDLNRESEFAGLWFHYDETFGAGGLTGEAWTGKHAYRLHQLNKKFEWAKYGDKDYWTESGNLTVEKTGQNYQLRFRVSSDYFYSGVAIKGPAGSYVAGVGGKDLGGVAYYRFTSKGLEGVWAVRGGEGHGSELLAPSDEVLKKAGSLFRDE